MQITKTKFGIIALLLFLAGVFATCELTSHKGEKKSYQEEAFLQQWKNDKAQTVAYYERAVKDLEVVNDSLSQSVERKKTALNTYKEKARVFEEQLQQIITKADTGSISVAILRPAVDSLVFSEQERDTVCDQTVQILEKQIVNRDSSLALQKKADDSLKDLLKVQEEETQALTDNLNQALKSERRKIIQNKFLSGGLLILTGLTTTLLIRQSLR